MQISFVFHLLGLTFLFGGLLLGSRLIKIGGDGVAPQPIQLLAKKIAFGYIVPGFVLMLISGIYQLMVGGMAQYMKQGWMHTKLTLVAVLIWSAIVIFLNLLAMSRGEISKARLGAIHHGIVATILLVILFLTFVKPF